MATCILSLALAACVAPIAPPQAPPNSMGPFVGVAHTISMAKDSYSGSTALSTSAIYFKDVGIPTTPPFEWTTGTPDWRIASILKGAKAPLPDIDGMSVGLDWILANNKGEVSVPVGQWGALSFSVTKATTGATGSVLKEESTGPGGAQADLFTYGLPGSNLPAWLVDRVVRAQNDDEVNVRSATTGKVSDIDGHDLFISAWLLGGAFTPLLPTDPRFYFTVSKATISRIPTAWWSSTKPSGASIFVTQWDSKNSVWSRPAVFLRYSDLGLLVSEDIDALAVDEARKRVLFSTTTSTRDPVRIALPVGQAIKVFIYKLTNGTKVSSRLGLLTGDDVDAICSLDPGGGQAARFLPAILGSPQRQRLIPNTNLPARTSVSAHRARRNNQDVIESYFIGWPNPRFPARGQAAVAITIPGPFSPFWFVGVFNRNLTARVPGSPIMVRGNVPRTLQLKGQPILIHWLAVDNFSTDLPHPVLIRL